MISFFIRTLVTLFSYCSSDILIHITYSLENLGKVIFFLFKVVFIKDTNGSQCQDVLNSYILSGMVIIFCMKITIYMSFILVYFMHMVPILILLNQYIQNGMLLFSSNSIVNLMSSEIQLRCSKNLFNSYFMRGHITLVSSTYLLHLLGFMGYESNALLSKFSIKMLATIEDPLQYHRNMLRKYCNQI